MKHTILLTSEVEGFSHTKLMEQVITAALEAEGVAVACEIGVLITDDAGIHEINLQQRGVDRPTDVLSFPMFAFAPGTPPTAETAQVDPGSGLLPLGDMVISLERCAAQAAAFGHSLERELAYLTVHSILHLLGYDHMDDGPMKARMRQREETILQALGITREG